MLVRALFVALSVAVSLAAEERRPFDVLHYRTAVTIPASGAEVAIRSEISIKAIETIDSIVLDLAGMTVDRVEHESRATSYERNGEQLRIALQAPLEPFRATTVSIQYHGAPADGLIIKQTKHGDRSIFADNWPNRARHWLVSRDHPSDKASVEFIVEAPASLTVVANGRLERVSDLPGGAKQWHWHEPTPIPVHTMVIGATSFTVTNASSVAGTEISYYLFPRDADAAVRQFGRTGAMLEYFTARVGPFPYEKLAIVQSSTRFGGMENAGAIFLAEKPVGGEQSLERLVAHEIAHQWFGDSVTQERWHDLWLSEGFATYYAALFAEHVDGREAFERHMEAARTRYFKQYADDPKPIFDPSIGKLADLLNGNNYDKGAWVLHMLRRLVGDETFHRGVADYYEAYRDKNVSTDNFRDVMERAAGVDLDWFFAQWITGRGYPVLTSSWSWAPESKTVTLRIAQTQKDQIFRAPLDVEIRTASGAKRVELMLDEQSETATFTLDEAPAAVVIDPDDWLLKQMATGPS